MIRKVCCLFTAVLTLMAFAPAANSQQHVRVRNADRPAAGSVELQIFELVNRQRERERLSRLTWNDEIADVARAYSERMAREGFFDHYDPEGRTAIDRAEKVRGWRMIGENLFVCEPVPDLAPFALRGWMASETHRTNLLDKQWTSTGIGIAQASNGDLYITELFTRK